jgi:hypothetical protein
VCERNDELAHLSPEQTPPVHKASCCHHHDGGGDDDDDDSMGDQYAGMPLSICVLNMDPTKQMQIAILLFDSHLKKNTSVKFITLNHSSHFFHQTCQFNHQASLLKWQHLQHVPEMALLS